MTTYKIEKILEESVNDFEFMRDLVNEMTAWDGFFADSPMEFWPMDELSYVCREMFYEGAIFDILQACGDGVFSVADKFFYHDGCAGWESTNEPDFAAYIPDMAQWLVENYDTSAFPKWLEDDEELMDAIRDAYRETNEVEEF